MCLVVPSLSLFAKLRHSWRQGSLVWLKCLFSCFMTFPVFAFRNTIRLVIWDVTLIKVRCPFFWGTSSCPGLNTFVTLEKTFNYKRGEMKGIYVWRKSSKSAVKWSEVKCGDVRWNGVVGNLNGVKPNEKVVKCSWAKFKWEEVKCWQV